MKEQRMQMIEAVRAYTEREAVRRRIGLSGTETLCVSPLAQGECNVNFLLTVPETGRKLVFRVNLVSQMHLPDQIDYEYRALKAVEGSGRTPRALFADAGAGIGNGIMVYEYLPGRPLRYETDLFRAAELLAEIHSIPADNEKLRLLAPEEPLSAILSECEEMVRTYMEAPCAEAETKRQIRRLLDRGHRLLADAAPYTGRRCVINTELNSGNFLMNDGGRDYLIDWEKPLYGEAAQDLGHFLAPTTTFWKTDVILSREEILAFTEMYARAAGTVSFETLSDRLSLYLPITCLRGITWCAMAYVQYRDPSHPAPKNEDTGKKLCAYLEKTFLDKIEHEWLFC